MSITLNRPDRRNAFGRQLRDAFVEAISVAQLDDSMTRVVLAGAGPSFSSGGDLDEFGTTPDPVTAHRIRMGQSPGWAVHEVRDRMRVELHGACIGAGIEIPAFADRVEARVGTWFRLPELSMGLIPGAGGTVSMTRRMGRWRLAYLVLSGAAVDLDTALRWGLVDARL